MNHKNPIVVDAIAHVRVSLENSLWKHITNLLNCFYHTPVCSVPQWHYADAKQGTLPIDAKEVVGWFLRFQQIYTLPFGGQCKARKAAVICSRASIRSRPAAGDFENRAANAISSGAPPTSCALLVILITATHFARLLHGLLTHRNTLRSQSYFALASIVCRTQALRQPATPSTPTAFRAPHLRRTGSSPFPIISPRRS